MKLPIKMAKPIKMVKHTAQIVFEAFWATAFRIVGRSFKSRAKVTLASIDGGEKQRRVLVVTPHPDDEIAGCAGALVAHRRRGDRVVVACVTDGRRSRAFGLSPDEMAATRRSEAEKAAAVLDIELQWFGLREGRWQPDELTGRLRELFARLRPDLVYAPSRVDFHHEHERVARVLAAALDGEHTTPLVVRIYPIQVPLSPVLANVVVSIPDTGLLEQALHCYTTQRGSLECCLRLRRYSACLHGLAGAAEEFWQMNLEQYRLLHRKRPERPLTKIFRSLRYYAWSDPLAYLYGRSERRRLLGLAESLEPLEVSAPELAPAPDWRLRSFRSGDEPGIAALFENGFGHHLGADTWHWKYKQYESPVENVWLAVDDSDHPVFHYGGMPRQMVVEGEIRSAMITADGVTDPRFRRRGIFTAAMRDSHQAFREAGLACVLGLPNDQWGSRVEAFDWRPLFPLRWQIRPLRPERLLAKRLGLPVLSRFELLRRLWSTLFDRSPDSTLEIREVERPDQEFEEFCEECRPEMGLIRDREWLEWRFFSCPQHRYRMLAAFRSDRLVGYLVYRFDGDHRYGFIVDLLTRPQATGVRQALIGAAIARIDRLGANAVATLSIPGSDLFRSFRGAGFLLSWGEFTVRCVPLADDLPFSQLQERHRWWLTGGDFDVV